jgi:excisionase family DNA binding protein
MVATDLVHGPVVAAADERPALAASAAVLAAEDEGIKLVSGSGACAELPVTARRLLQAVVRALAEERPVAVEVWPRELTIPQAADLLDLAAGDVGRLIEAGELSVLPDGTHRRIRFEDAMAYKERRDTERRAALDELARMSQEIEPLLR